MAQPDATVLIVDDEPSLVDLYALRLDDRYAVRKAHNGEEALEQMDGTVDVVLLDRRMPDLRGGEVLERLRDEGYDCRVAMVTAVDPNFDVLEMGFDAYLVKPVRAEELNGTIERLLEQDAYDDDVQRLLSMATRLATIEDRKSKTELADSAVYERLKDDFEESRERLADRGKDVDEAIASVYGQ